MARKFEFDGLPVVQTKAESCAVIPVTMLWRSRVCSTPKPSVFRHQWRLNRGMGMGSRMSPSYGFVCPLLTPETPTGELLVPHRYWPQNENCQNLNIWTPCADSAKRPVLVWLHGGGFAAGFSIEQKAYNGSNMSRKGDVVVVSINHRLNVLGFLDLSLYGERYANSANAGQAYLVAALGWVQEKRTFRPWAATQTMSPSLGSRAVA